MRREPILLTYLSNQREVSLNRPAAADPTDALDVALSKADRETIALLVAQAMESGAKKANFIFDDTADAIYFYLGLRIGDLQIRSTIGRLERMFQRQLRNVQTVRFTGSAKRSRPEHPTAPSNAKTCCLLKLDLGITLHVNSFYRG